MSDIIESVLQRLLKLHEEDIIVPQHHVRQLVKPGLKVIRNSDKLKYTVSTVSADEITLRDSAMGTILRLNLDDFAQNYSVD